MVLLLRKLTREPMTSLTNTLAIGMHRSGHQERTNINFLNVSRDVP